MLIIMPMDDINKTLGQFQKICNSNETRSHDQ